MAYICQPVKEVKCEKCNTFHDITIIDLLELNEVWLKGRSKSVHIAEFVCPKCNQKTTSYYPWIHFKKD